jgi:thiol-disulfide isomerase/thioredoxin
MTMKTLLRGALLLALSANMLFAIDHLKLNSKLDYTSDSLDGPLISGDDAQSGFVAGKPNYVLIYGEGCFNSKRQARRTVELYEKYRDKVHFVVVDLDGKPSPEQQKLVKQYYQGYIPHVVVLDTEGKPLYNSSGEVESKKIEALFDQSMRQVTPGNK